MTEVILWGGTGHSRVLRELLSRIGHTVVAVVDNREIQPPFIGPDILKGPEGLRLWLSARRLGNASLVYALAIGGGYGRDRLALAQELDQMGLEHLSLVHPLAVVASDAILARGSQVLMGAAVSANVRIGTCSIINTSAIVDHDCIVGDGVHIGPAATLCGDIQVGDGSFIGAGATILPHLKIGNDVTIGAGSVVTRDIPAGSTVTGIPAKHFQV